jgi:hypothetical protein
MVSSIASQTRTSLIRLTWHWACAYRRFSEKAERLDELFFHLPVSGKIPT